MTTFPPPLAARSRTPRPWVLVVVGVLLVASLVWRVLDGGGAETTDGWWPYLTVVLAASLAAWWGTLRQPRGQRFVPTLISAGITFSAVGDLFNYASDLTGSEGWLTIAEVCWAASLGLFALAVARVLVVSVPRQARYGSILDTLTVIVVSLLIFYSETIQEVLADPERYGFRLVVLAFLPVGDAVILALVVRALTNGRRQTLNVWFALGMACWLVADIIVLGFDVTDQSLMVSDAAFMVGSTLLALAIWTRVGARRAQADLEAPPRVAGLLITSIAPLVVPPLLLLLNQARERDVGPWEPLVGVLALLLIAYLRILGLLRELSDARHDLMLARDAAMEASRAKSAFIATTSHEIRTPMNGVIGLAGLLADTRLDERQRQYALGITTAGESLLAILNDILDFARGEAGRFELETIDFSVLELVEEVAGLVAYPAQSKQLELLAYCSPELPVGLRGDPTRLRQVLLNLAGNAVKFTERGEVVIRAQLEGRAADGRLEVRFEVTDTGVGIDPAATERLFQPFSQADSSTTRRYGGTGLGLAICHQLVTSMGGVIGVESTPGQGSMFWFTVPLATAVNPIAPPPVPAALDGRRVLVVDDNATNRMMLSEQLRAWGMRADLVADGPAALARLADSVDAGDPYAVLILDMLTDGMEGMDGIDVARRVTADRRLADTPMVLLSSSNDVSLQQARDAGIATSLTKPVPLQRLRTALSGALAPRPTTEEPDAAGHDPETPAPAPAPIRLLVVEDDEVNQLVAGGILAQLGYVADFADHGEAALEALATGSYGAVLMDCHMPRMDGYQTTTAWRQREGGGRRTPIIAMTAGALDDERARCLDAGMDDYLTKPVRTAELAAALQRWVPTSPAADRTRPAPAPET